MIFTTDFLPNQGGKYTTKVAFFIIYRVKISWRSFHKKRLWWEDIVGKYRRDLYNKPVYDKKISREDLVEILPLNKRLCEKISWADIVNIFPKTRRWEGVCRGKISLRFFHKQTRLWEYIVGTYRRDYFHERAFEKIS